MTIGADTDHAAPADVIIVLGCTPDGDEGPNPCIQTRADHAADLYRKGLASHVIASGNSEETATLARLLEAGGVPTTVIILEDQSHDTIQNIHNSHALMRSHGWRTAILVTEPYHIKRAALVARDAGLTAYSSPAVNSPNWVQTGPRIYHLGRDTLSLMLYQVKTLFGVRS